MLNRARSTLAIVTFLAFGGVQRSEVADPAGDARSGAVRVEITERDRGSCRFVAIEAAGFGAGLFLAPAAG